jgi:hypothetical protein
VIGIDVHPLRLRGHRVDQANGAAADRPITVARHEKGAAAVLEMFRLEVWPEALLGRIELAQRRVQRCDQSSRVLGIERLGGDGQAHGVLPSMTEGS